MKYPQQEKVQSNPASVIVGFFTFSKENSLWHRCAVESDSIFHRTLNRGARAWGKHGMTYSYTVLRLVHPSDHECNIDHILTPDEGTTSGKPRGIHGIFFAKFRREV
jgi:hypothetical protein